MNMTFRAVLVTGLLLAALPAPLVAAPAKAATHEQTASLELKSKGKPVPVNTLCLDGKGNVLVACRGAKANEVRRLRPDGEPLSSWTLGFQPQAICAGPGGAVFVGGAGQLVRLDANGKVTKSGKTPLNAATAPESSTKKDDPTAKRQRAMAARRKLDVPGIAATKQDVFVVSRALKGYGFDVYRLDHDFKNPKKIVTDLRGCCGQMGIAAGEGKLFVAENGRHRVLIFDREGKKLKSFGKRARKGDEGFGGCCNPMNLCLTADGSLYTSEATLGRIKRYKTDGTLVAVVGKTKVVPGCRHVAIGVDRQGRVFQLDTAKSTVHVLSGRGK
jgi:sugar lactone lactonase YvrE